MSLLTPAQKYHPTLLYQALTQTGENLTAEFVECAESVGRGW
ncbi:MAG: hypothetical protein ACI8Z5_002636 [Lentimonas sp.]|jgi:hypothetical protein